MLDWIKRVRDWRRRAREWNAAHAEAWAGCDVEGDTGLTAFQVRCETALSEHLGRRGVRLTARSVEDAPGTEGGTDIRARIAESAWWVAIYRDGVEILREVAKDDDPEEPRGSFRFCDGFTVEHDLEHWDALTPDDLIALHLRLVDSVLDRAGL